MAKKKILNLYLVSRTDSCDYDEYLNYVVAAYSPEDALAIGKGSHPEIGCSIDFTYGWKTDPEIVLLGVADTKNIKRCIVNASFRAG